MRGSSSVRMCGSSSVRMRGSSSSVRMRGSSSVRMRGSSRCAVVVYGCVAVVVVCGSSVRMRAVVVCRCVTDA